MRVILCDDHEMFLEALTSALSDLGHDVVAVSTDATEIVDLAVGRQPDLCVMDASISGRSALDVAARVRDRAPAVKVLLLTSSVTSEVWEAYDQDRVDGVVGKVCGIDLLQTSIIRLAKGDRVFEGWLREADAVDDRPAHSEQVLTDRERQVLELLADGATTSVMSAKLGISSHTVRTHVKHVLRKLGVHGRVEAANLVVARRLLDRRTPVEPPPDLLREA
jgi:two-component system, NarL family, nitrate/nitrite response regulator NarL